MKSKWKEDKSIFIFVFFFAVMMVYYGWRMVSLTPWYDELYTYYCFISKGPIYAGIHWPLPNNHMGYSVLSGFLNYFGNSYWGLRGISYLCALLNLVLIFRFSRHFIKKEAALLPVILYTAMNLVNQMAVQGRGYTLATTCFLVATEMLYTICSQDTPRKRYYIGFIASIVWGLYTLPSSVYWVVPLCLCGGFYELWEIGVLPKNQKKQKINKLITLIVTSLIAALITIAAYSIVWLAIGSNLLIKNQNSAYFNQGHFGVIFKAPIKSLLTGMQYMLDTPYIQSVSRQGYMKQLFDWILVLLNYFYTQAALLLGILILSGLVICVLILCQTIIHNKEEKNGKMVFLTIYLLLETLGIPVLLLIQCALPYYRVFTYAGVLVSFLITLLFEWVSKKFSLKKCEILLVVASGCMMLLLLFSKGYNAQYGLRENEIAKAYDKVVINDYANIAVTDCNQQYLLKFLYGITCENREIENSDLVLLDRRMTDPDFDTMEWEFYHYYDDIPWDYVNKELTVVYEGSDYILYSKK